MRGIDLRRGRRWREIARPDDFLDLLAVQSLVLEQRIGDKFKSVPPADDDVLCDGVCFIDDTLDLVLGKSPERAIARLIEIAVRSENQQAGPVDSRKAGRYRR